MCSHIEGVEENAGVSVGVVFLCLSYGIICFFLEIIVATIDYLIRVNSTQAKANINALTAEVNKLDAAFKRTSTSLDGLISRMAALNSVNRILNGSLQTTNNTFIQITNNANHYGDVINRIERSSGGLNGSVLGLVGSFTTLKMALGAITSHGLDFEAWNAQFKAIYVTTGKVNENFNFLLDLSARTGQSINVLTENYLKFSSAAKFSGETEENIKTIYSNFTDVATVMHWSQEKTRSALTAIEQMYNKNQVMSEELKKQLGNVMPAAVNIFARSLDVTTPKLFEMMKAGAVLPKETIKNFSELAKQLLATQESLQDASGGFNAAMGRWDTAISLTSAAFYEELKPAIIGTVEVGTDAVNGLRKALEDLDKPIIKIEGGMYSLRTVFKKFWADQKNDAEQFFEFFGGILDIINKPRSMKPVNLSAEIATVGANVAGVSTTGSMKSFDAIEKARQAQLKSDRDKREMVALAYQKSLLSDPTAGDTEFTDKQIAKFIKKEADIAKQLIEEIGQSAKLQLNSLSSEQLKIENQFKNNQISINSYYEKRVEFVKKELEISLEKSKLEREIIKAEARRVENYQDIQLNNDKDVVKLQNLIDKKTSIEQALNNKYSQRDIGTINEAALKKNRDEAILSGKKLDQSIPLVIKSKDLADLVNKITELTKVVEEKKANLLTGMENGSYSPPTATSGGKSKGLLNADIIDAAAAKWGVDQAYMRMMAKIESGGNANAYNKSSGASGIFQFIPSTARAYGMNSSNVFDPTTNANAAAKFTSNNADYLKKHGIAINATNLYLSHQQGAGGLAEILKGNVSAKVRDGMNSNAGKGKTPAEFYALWDRKVKGLMGNSVFPTWNNKATMAQIDTSAKNTELQSQIKVSESGDKLKKNEAELKLQELDYIRNDLQKQFLDLLKETNIEHIKINKGETAAAEFELQNRDKLEKLQTALNDKANEGIKARIEGAITELAFKKEQLVLTEKIANLESAGGLIDKLKGQGIAAAGKQTTLGGAITKSVFGKAAYEDYSIVADQQIRAVNSDKTLSGYERAAKIGDITAKLAELKKESESIVTLFEDNLSSSIESSFMAWATGAKTAKEAVLDFGSSFVQTLQKMLAEEVAAAASKGLMKVGSSIIGSIFGAVAGGVKAGGLIGYAGGGTIRGAGTGISDSITAAVPTGSYIINNAAANAIGRPTLARISAGEFFMPPAAVAAYGVDRMNSLNRGNVPRFAIGGLVGNAQAVGGGGTVQNPQFVVNVTHTGKEDGSELGQKISIEMVKAIAKYEADKAARVATKKR